MKKLLLGATALILAVGGGIVIAQTITVPQVVSVGTKDLFNTVVGGVPTAGNKYATAAQINGVVGYSDGTAATTGWTHTYGNAETNFFIYPSGTLANGTITAAPNPGDGQRECFLSTQTQTSVTWTANTGQTLVNAPTAGTAMTPECMVYVASKATWYRSN